MWGFYLMSEHRVCAQWLLQHETNSTSAGRKGWKSCHVPQMTINSLIWMCKCQSGQTDRRWAVRRGNKRFHTFTCMQIYTYIVLNTHNLYFSTLHIVTQTVYTHAGGWRMKEQNHSLWGQSQCWFCKSIKLFWGHQHYCSIWCASMMASSKCALFKLKRHHFLLVVKNMPLFCSNHSKSVSVWRYSFISLCQNVYIKKQYMRNIIKTISWCWVNFFKPGDLMCSLVSQDIHAAFPFISPVCICR